MTVQEQGKPGQKCKVLKSWMTEEGSRAFEVQALQTGEIMTIVESGSAAPAVGPSRARAMATRIFHWGRNDIPPEGTPLPPPALVQTTIPDKEVESSKKTVIAQTPVGETISIPQGKSVMAAPERIAISPAPVTQVAATSDPGPQPLPVGATKSSTKDEAEEKAPEPRWTKPAPRQVAQGKASQSPYAPLRLPSGPRPKNESRPMTALNSSPSGNGATSYSSLAGPTVAKANSTAAMSPAAPEKEQTAQKPDGIVPLDPVPLNTDADSGSKPKATADKGTAGSTTQFLPKPLYPPKPRSAGSGKMMADAGTAAGSDQPKPLPAGVQAAPTSDWRESWGKPQDHSSKAAGSTLPVARSERTDPLLKDPENYGSPPADQTTAEKMPSSPVPASQAGGNNAEPNFGPIQTVEPQEERKHRGIFNSLLSAFSRKKETTPVEYTVVKPVPEKTEPVKMATEAAKAEPAKSAPEVAKTEPAKSDPEPSKFHFTLPEWAKGGKAKPPLPPEPAKVQQTKGSDSTTGEKAKDPLPPEPAKVQQTMGPTAPETTPDSTPGRPLGTASVMAAYPAGSGSVQYVPVSVVTLPDSTRPPEPRLPEPPKPKLPEAPQPNQAQNGMWANAFSDDAAANQPQGGGPNQPPYGWPGPMQQNNRHPLEGFSMQPTSCTGPMGRMPLPPTPSTAMSGPGGISPPPSLAYQRQQQQAMYMGQAGYPPMQPGMYPPNMGMPGQQGMYPPNMGMPGQQGMYPPNMPMPPQPGMYGPNVGNAAGQAMRPMGPGVVPAGYNSPAQGNMPAFVPNRPLVGPEGPSAQPIPQLLGILQESLYPSQREWAVESLAGYDWRTHPHIVEALVTAAAKDPAATVRTECVRALGKMNVNTLPVVNAVQALKGDADPRVRQAVEDTLATLTATKAEK
jgi:hypothetical protein